MIATLLLLLAALPPTTTPSSPPSVVIPHGAQRPEESAPPAPKLSSTSSVVIPQGAQRPEESAPPATSLSPTLSVVIPQGAQQPEESAPPATTLSSPPTVVIPQGAQRPEESAPPATTLSPTLSVVIPQGAQRPEESAPPATSLSSQPERSAAEAPATPTPHQATTQAAATQTTPQLASPLDRAEDAIEQGDYTRARTTLDDYLAHNKPDARALYDLGSVDLALNHAPQAEANLRRAIELDPKLPQIHIALGRALAAQNRSDEARKEWQTVAGDATTEARYRAEAWRAIAGMDVNLVAARATRQESPQDTTPSPLAAEARDALLEALKLSPETPADKLLAARIAIASGDPADAGEALRKAIAADPVNTDLQLELAGVLRTQRKFAEAEAALRPVHTAHPDDLAVTVMLAGTLASQDKNAEAMELLSAAHTAHPENASVTRMLADVANMRGSDPALASALLEQMLARQPDDADLLADYGASLVRQNRFAEAVPVLKRAVVARPENGDAWGSLAFAASRTGDFQTVLTALTQRKKYLADNASTYFLWGQAYDKLHRTREAADFYRQFLAAAGGKFPDQEFQVRHRLLAMGQNR